MSPRPPPPMEIEEAAKLLRLLGNAARLRLVLRIGAGRVSVAELETELSIRQPNLSQHLAELREAGLLGARREGRSVFYKLAGARAEAVVECLAKVIRREAPAARTAAPPAGAGASAGAAVFAKAGRRG